MDEPKIQTVDASDRERTNLLLTPAFATDCRGFDPAVTSEHSPPDPISSFQLRA